MQHPAALLSTCPGFLLIELGEEEHSGATNSSNSSSSNLSSSSIPAACDERVEHAALATSGIHQLGEAPEARESGWEEATGAAGAGGPGFAASFCRFVLHLRDELLVREGVVFGLVSRCVNPTGVGAIIYNTVGASASPIGPCCLQGG